MTEADDHLGAKRLALAEVKERRIKVRLEDKVDALAGRDGLLGSDGPDVVGIDVEQLERTGDGVFGEGAA